MAERRWPRLRVAALESVQLLGEVLADPSEEGRRLVDAYLEAKAVLADAFEARASELYGTSDELATIVQALEREMRVAFPLIPAEFRRVRGFGAVHGRLLAYLSVRRGDAVSGAELRTLTGDAVHTERRARELRELGLDLVARTTGGVDTYTLGPLAPDLSDAARRLIEKNIQSAGRLSDAEKNQLLDYVRAGATT